jgi:multidrug efflux pump
MVLGALPLALASGAGAEARNQIGWVIVGGMSIGTVFTLFVVPVIYLLLGRVHKHMPEAMGEPAAA